QVNRHMSKAIKMGKRDSDAMMGKSLKKKTVPGKRSRGIQQKTWRPLQGAARSNRTLKSQNPQRLLAILDKRARLPTMLIILARRRDLAEETICLIVDPGGEEEFVR